METYANQGQPLPGDYYGLIYKGPLITPILGIALVVGLWWLLKRRRS